MENNITINVNNSEDCVLQVNIDGKNLSDYKISDENAKLLIRELFMYLNNKRKPSNLKLSEYFNTELDLIEDNKIKQAVAKVINELPIDPFLYKGASSSGKYHPVECRYEKGLMLHTKYAVQAGLVLIDQDTKLNNDKDHSYDYIIGALLLHDGFKYGYLGTDEYTDSDHPKLIADYLIKKGNNESDEEIRTIYFKLSELTRSHHGKWGDAPLDSREKEYVHIADMIASRAHLIRFNPAE